MKHLASLVIYFQQNAANNSHSNIGFIQRVAHFIYLFLFFLKISLITPEAGVPQNDIKSPYARLVHQGLSPTRLCTHILAFI